MENLTDDQLLDFLDGTGHETEKEEIKNAVIASDVVKRRMQALEAVHRYLKRQHGLESPSKNFTEKVMAGLHSKTSFAFLSPKNGLLLLLGLMVASGIAIPLMSSGAFDQWHTFFTLGQVPIKNNWVKLPASIPFDLKVVVKLFLILNIIVGFVLLDRTILRPIFQKRAERFI